MDKKAKKSRFSRKEDINCLFRKLNTDCTASRLISQYALKQYQRKGRQLIISILCDDNSSRTIKTDFGTDKNFFFDAYINSTLIASCLQDKRIDWKSITNLDFNPETQYLLNFYCMDRLNPINYLNNIAEYKLCKVMTLRVSDKQDPLLKNILLMR